MAYVTHYTGVHLYSNAWVTHVSQRLSSAGNVWVCKVSIQVQHATGSKRFYYNNRLLNSTEVETWVEDLVTALLAQTV